MTCSPTNDLPIHCDWLDVTFSPTDCPFPEVNGLLLSLGFSVERDAGGMTQYVPPSGRGTVRVQHASRYAKISASGGALAALRSAGSLDAYLMALSVSPHKVTRLDAALDVPLDGADVLLALADRYPGGTVGLGRKALPVTRILSVRADGRESGTYYVGHRTAARFTARVYDKALEAWVKRGESLPPTTRYEITARKDSGATLRDASVPASLFWHVAAPALLQRPEGVAMWEPNQDGGWPAPVRGFDPAETLRRRVESSAELEALAALSDLLGASGRAYLLHMIEKQLRPDAAGADAA